MATSSAAVTATKGPKLKVLPFDPHGDRLDLGNDGKSGLNGLRETSSIMDVILVKHQK